MKHGFKTFAAKTNPLPRKTKTLPKEDPNGRKQLPNGFYIGDRIYYTLTPGGKKYWGTVTDECIEETNRQYGPSEIIWAHWDDDDYGHLGFVMKNETLRDMDLL